MGDEERNLWLGSTLTEDDLVAFLDGDLTMCRLWDSMDLVEERYLLGDINVVVPTFRLDLLQTRTNVRLRRDPTCKVEPSSYPPAMGFATRIARVRTRDELRDKRRKQKRDERRRKNRGRR